MTACFSFTPRRTVTMSGHLVTRRSTAESWRWGRGRGHHIPSLHPPVAQADEVTAPLLGGPVPQVMAGSGRLEQLLESIERDALLRCVERPLGAPHMRWPPSRGALRLLYTHRTPSRRVPLARRPPAAAAASPPLTRACLISAYSDVHSGRPLERALRLARAHRAPLVRPSAAQAPSRVPLGRYIAIDAPPCGARCRPEATA